jgi:hypothetical protein
LKMPKLFYKGDWYDELSPTALAESEFEALLIKNAPIIAPSCVVIPFKKTVESEIGTARADLAAIAEDYREWIVIEAELDIHSLPGHVIPQTRVLRTGLYDPSFASYICSKNRRLQLDKVEEMLLGTQPKVLVLVNKAWESWRRELARYDIEVMGFELYRSDLNRHIFRIDGEIAVLPSSLLTELSWSPLPRCLTVHSPAALPFKTGEQMRAFVGDQLTFWERFETAAECYISPVGQMPLLPGQRYGLYIDDQGEHVIQELNGEG